MTEVEKGAIIIARKCVQEARTIFEDAKRRLDATQNQFENAVKRIESAKKRATKG
jgi:hypothetical protein